MNARVLSTVVTLALSTNLAAQTGYNVDIADASSPTAPASTYGAAAGQAGVWNAVPPGASGQSIVNISGTNQGVTLTSTGGYTALSYNDASTAGNDQSLLDDFHDTDAAAETATWTFAGLQPGNYQVYTYAFAPDGSAFQSNVNVLQSSTGPQAVGGSFSSGFVLGVTHAVHFATVTSNETLTIQVTAGSQYASINGFQIVQVSGDPGSPPSQATSPSPSNSATSVAVSTQICWSNGGGATSYDVYLGTDATPDSSEFIGTQIGTCYDPPGSLAYSTTYYWRVDARNSGGTTTGTVWSFTTGAQPVSPPSQPTNPSPSNAATNVAVTAATSWTNGGGATSYDVYFGTDSTPDAGEFVGNQSATSFDPAGNLANSTTYYWRIDAKNAGGTTTGVVWSFTTQAPVVTPPSQASNPSPSNGASNVLATATTSWSNGGGATSYDVYFGTDSTPDSGEFIGNQVSTSWDPPGNLGYSTVYYWRIDAKNSGGTTTGTVWSFTTQAQPAQPPLQAVNPSPANAATNVNLTTQICWANGGNATSYDVYFGQDITPDAGEFKGNTASTCWDPPGDLLPNTVYFWRIDAKNAGGTTTGATWGFTTHPATVTIAGQILYDGVALAGVMINANNGGGQTFTDGNGNFTLSSVPFNWSGTITPTLDGFTFTPASYSFTQIAANSTERNFTAFTAGSIVMLTGELANDQFGTVVAALGDVDGDSVPDFAVGAPFADSDLMDDHGKVYVYSGADLSLIGFPLSGQAEGDRFGAAIAAGDADADGRNDLLIGAPFVNASGKSDAGRVYLYAFKDGLWSILNVESGAGAGDHLGQAVAMADVNGDGKSDLIVGAPYNDDVLNNAGRVYVYSGANFTTIEKLNGQKKSDLFGFSVARIGKINSDSDDDFLVGAPYNDDGGSNAGKVYVYSGATMGQSGTPAPVRTHKGPSSGTHFGRAVAGVGKINADSRDEYAVGAPYFNTSSNVDAGRVYVFSGTNGDQLWAKSGSNKGDLNGWSVAGGYDIDGNGGTDLVIGPPRHDATGVDAGKAYIRRGSDGDVISSQFSGQNPGDWYGYSVAMVGDLDGDGISEMLVGAPRNDAAGSNAGAAYLHLSNNSDFAQATLPDEEVAEPDDEEFVSFENPAFETDDELDLEDPDLASDQPTAETCVAEVAGNNGMVDNDDLMAVINAMGQANATFDITSDGIVDVNDIAAVMAAWGACP
jgi:hypothetical protein